MQYFLGLEGLTFKPVFDPSLMVTIRMRLGIDFFNRLTLALHKEEQRRRDKEDSQKGGGNGDKSVGGSGTDKEDGKAAAKIKIDATCCPSEMRYPTDLNLIEDGSRLVERLLEKLWSKDKSVKRQPLKREMARSAFLKCVKKKFKERNLRKSTKQTQIRCLEHDLQVFLGCIGQHKGGLRAVFTKSDLKAVCATMEMPKQQKEMLSNGIHQCADRIVSIFQPHVRPIVRGKLSARTVFGAKIGIAVVDGYTYIDHLSWDAYNESEDLKTHIRKYEERFGRKPDEILADKIYLNKDNRKWLKGEEIQCHCAPLGRPPKNPDPESARKRKEACSQRNEVECSFGTAKRVYEADDIRAKLPETAKPWIGACFFAKNIMKFLRGLFVSILRELVIFVKNSYRYHKFDSRLTGMSFLPKIA